jgi:DnaJ-class molecular chaperone
MKISKHFFVISILMLTTIAPAGETKKRDRYIRLDKSSSMRKYNPNAVWRKVKCRHCNGTGHITRQRYNSKTNRMHKWLEPCPYCKGRGTTGMSKK